MTQNNAQSTLPTIVIGAGPIGLAAAAHLLERGLEPLVLEAGHHAAAAVRSWGHVRLFSAWGELVDPAAARLLSPTGWTSPEVKDCPTAAEWADLYLQPLADVLGDRVVHDTTVTGIARRGRDRVVDSGRTEQPFTIHTTDAHGIPARLSARAVVDASGTFATPNPLGADGYPADGEAAHSESISYRVPNLRSPDGQRQYAGRRTAVVGSGHSALTALVALAELGVRDPATRAVWVLRRGAVGNAYGGGQSDELPARGALGARAREAVDSGPVEVVHGFRTRAVEGNGAHLSLVSDDGRRIDELDRIIGLTGFRPDHSMASELRLTLDGCLEAPARLAPLIDPNVHSCGTVSPHGAAELAHEEEGVFLVGMKSYGRAPTFLAMTGYEQVRSVAAALAGDHEAAARVELVLPDTGVCGGAGLFDASEPFSDTAAGSCCTPEQTLVQIGAGAPAAPRC